MKGHLQSDMVTKIPDSRWDDTTEKAFCKCLAPSKAPQKKGKCHFGLEVVWANQTKKVSTLSSKGLTLLTQQWAQQEAIPIFLRQVRPFPYILSFPLNNERSRWWLTEEQSLRYFNGYISPQSFPPSQSEGWHIMVKCNQNCVVVPLSFDVGSICYSIEEILLRVTN